MPSLEKDFDFFKDRGLLTGSIKVADVVDTSFVEEALRVLGTHK
jgi:hypothetical protein